MADDWSSRVSTNSEALGAFDLYGLCPRQSVLPALRAKWEGALCRELCFPVIFGRLPRASGRGRSLDVPVPSGRELSKGGLSGTKAEICNKLCANICQTIFALTTAISAVSNRLPPVIPLILFV